MRKGFFSHSFSSKIQLGSRVSTLYYNLHILLTYCLFFINVEGDSKNGSNMYIFLNSFLVLVSGATSHLGIVLYTEIAYVPF